MVLLGISTKSRKLLVKALSNNEGVLTSLQVSKTLNVPKNAASALLTKWSKTGWLRKVRRGLYIPVNLDSETKNIPIEDPWLIATEAFSPCYIGGWTAAQYWDFTEQIFHTMIIMTSRHFDTRHQKIGEIKCLIKEIPKTKIFGTKTSWRGTKKIEISDPTKTIIDILDTPLLAGGIRTAADMLLEYLNSKHFDAKKLIIYAEQNENKTVFKRLGFLIEKIKPELSDLITHCKERISKGYSQLDPSVKEKNINTRWRLRVPKNDL